MTPTLTLLNIIAGVFLLLWGLGLLKMGMTYGFGAQLRHMLQASTKYRLSAFLSGIGITALLQSSTATVLIVSTFAAQGMVTGAAGLAMVLGADVGTTIVAQIFTLDLSWLIPVLIILGCLAFSRKKQSKLKNIGRIFIGAALMLVALGFIREATEPLKNSDILPLIIDVLGRDFIFSILIAALLTWVAHSSLAVILLIVSFSSVGLLPINVALYMVLGANLGGIMPPIIATMKDTAIARRLPIGNACIRFTGVVFISLFVPMIVPYLAQLDSNETRQIVHFHMLFNLSLAVLFLPFTGKIMRIIEKFIPDDTMYDDKGKALYLDYKAINTPATALAAATRETLRMCDIVQQMLDDTITVLKNNDMALLEKVREEDDTLDQIYEQIKIYMASLSQEFMDETEATRYIQVLTFSTNLEHVGDVIDKNLMPLALKKIKRQIEFSDAGLKEIEHIHTLVCESVALAQSIFVSGDMSSAQKLLDDKQIIKNAEINGMNSHIERLGDGVPETMATSSLHIDIIRDYRRINSYICSVAYPLLDQKTDNKGQK